MWVEVGEGILGDFWKDKICLFSVEVEIGRNEIYMEENVGSRSVFDRLNFENGFLVNNDCGLVILVI